MEHRVLEVLWKPLNDQLCFDMRALDECLQNLEPTKQNVIGAAARIYDPFGVL